MGLFKLSIMGLIALAASIESAHVISTKSALKKWKCPEKDTEGVTVTYPYETDCHKFYECERGKLIEKECEEGLNYDPKQKLCDFIDDVVCYQTTTTATETPSTITTQEPTKTTHTQSPTTTTTEPTSTMSTVITTPVTETTSTAVPTTTIPTKAPTSTPIPIPTTMPTTIPTTTLKPAPTTTSRPRPEDCVGTCPAKDPLYVVQLPHKNCTKFCKCSGGLAYVMSCPAGLQYNKDLQNCVFPWQSTCDTDQNLLRAIPKKASIQKRQAPYFESSSKEEDIDAPVDFAIESTLASESDFDPKTCIGRCPDLDPLNFTVQLPNEACDKFCKCSGGKAYVISCPKGLEYSRDLGVCTWPSQANCVSSTNSSELTDTPSSSTTSQSTTQAPTTVEDLTTTLSPVPFKLLKQMGRKVNDTSKSVLLLKIVEDKDQHTGLIEKFKSLFNFQ